MRRRAARRARSTSSAALLCVLGLAGPVFALIEAPTRGFSDPLILVTLLGGIALFGALPPLGARARRSPMLPLRLFRRRNFSFANLETFTVYAALSTLGLLPRPVPPAARRVLAVPERRSRPSPITIVMFFLSPRVGRLSMRFGPALLHGRRPARLRRSRCSGCASSRPTLDYWTELLPALLVFSLGLSMIVAPLTATVLADAGEGDAGIASRRQQRRRARRRPARDRGRRRRDRRRREPARPRRATGPRWRSPPACSSSAARSGSPASARRRRRASPRLAPA